MFHTYELKWNEEIDKIKIARKTYDYSVLIIKTNDLCMTEIYDLHIWWKKCECF